MDALTEALAAACDLLCWRLRYREFDLQGPAGSWYGRRWGARSAATRCGAAPRSTMLSARNVAPSPIAEISLSGGR